jgi:phosphomannomutase
MKFGTSGLRGLVADMTDAVCAAYAGAFLDHLAASGPAPAVVLLGRDLRPSSPRIADACAGAIRARGVDTVDCGALPTPALALEAARRNAPAIMVTGSHIPFDRNGVKFYRGADEITKDDEAGIVAALDRPGALAIAPGRAAEDVGALARYIDRPLSFFRAGALAGWRIGVYQHSAVGRDALVQILTALGAESIPLGRADSFVPIDTEAVRPEDATQARAWAAEHRLDALVTTDGDGDRPLIADETGRFLRGDLLGVLTAKALGADAVATPVSSNTALERCGWFPRVARTRIGSPYVIESMARLAADGARLVVGYEANGGFLLGGAVAGEDGRTLAALPTRDAVTPMLATLDLAARDGVPLSALADRLPARFTASDRLPDAPQAATGPFLDALLDDPAARAALLDSIGAPAVASVDKTDGVRMTLADEEIVHLRASGNAPELRCYAEAADPDRAAALVTATLSAARTRLDG